MPGDAPTSLVRGIGEAAGDYVSRVVHSFDFEGVRLDLTPSQDPDLLMRGASSRRIYDDSSGGNWLFKYGLRRGGPEKEQAAHELARLVGLPVAPSRLATIDGNFGFLQKMYPNSESFYEKTLAMGGRQYSTQDAEDILQRYAFSTATGDIDLHSANFLHLKDNGRIVGIDHGQAFLRPENIGVPERWSGTPADDVLMQMSSGDIAGGKGIARRTLDWAKHIGDVDEEPYRDILNTLPNAEKVRPRAIAAKRHLESIFKKLFDESDIPVAARVTPSARQVDVRTPSRSGSGRARAQADANLEALTGLVFNANNR